MAMREKENDIHRVVDCQSNSSHHYHGNCMKNSSTMSVDISSGLKGF